MSRLVLERVAKRYGDASALEGVDLEVAAGSRTAIVGPSGSGKTTLLRLVAGFEAPDRGRLVLDGTVLADDATFVPAHRRGVGVVMQDGALFPHLTVGDNIGFGLDRHTPDRAGRIAALMRTVELDPSMRTRRPDALSGGQQQRVALARALARAPRLMLLDEPFSALDTALRAGMRRAVAKVLDAAGITTILVTHDQAEALSFSDQIAVLAAGRLLQAGAPRALYAHPVNRAVAEFLGEAIILPARLDHGQAHCALGTIATADPARSGSAEIMLRPEQVSFAMERGDPRPGAVRADVLAVEDAGSVQTVTLRVAAAPPVELTIAQRSHAAPSPGDVVAITVAGTAHVLPG